MFITTYEASIKHGLSTSHLRRLLANGIIQGRQASITSKSLVWLVEEKSLRRYLKKDRTPGPKARK